MASLLAARSDTMARDTSPSGAADLELDNSGEGPMRVPGFNMPVSLELEKLVADAYGPAFFKLLRFAHGVNGYRPPRLTVTEVAMLRLMDALTDKPNWQVKVFDDGIVDRWRAEATAIRDVTDATFSWCITELRDKAGAFEETGKVITYDSANRVVKSDSAVSEELRQALLAGVEPLLSVPDEQKDWHPNSNGQVLNLVHPSLFPLVYGTTRVLTQGGKVDLADIFSRVGQGEVAPLTGPESHFWSRRFQWLPCEVEFASDKGTDVRITSYINNLHPEKHAALYRVIEQMISVSIPLWDDVLIKGSDGRTPQRIVTYGAGYAPELPDWAVWSSLPDSVHHEKWPEFLDKMRAYMALPNRPGYEDEEHEGGEDEDVVTDAWLEQLREWSDAGEVGHRRVARALSSRLENKWERIREFQLPEPAETYEEWKQGIVKAAVNEPGGRRVEPRHKFYDVHIEDRFRKQGLQVIAKLSSIELTPEKPDYAGGNWHLEGMLNEHIVATAIYYYDVDNVTEARLGFRQEADLDEMELQYSQDDHGPLARIFGTSSMRDEPAVQDLGHVTTPQGRLLVFPNTLQHRVAPFRLADPSRAGHRRFVVLWLVDPHYRVCSTRNVPPQQHDWWAEKSLPGVDFGKLPGEIVNMISDDIKDFPMGLDQAKQLRLELMEERTSMVGAVERGFAEYNLCEH